MTIPSSVDRVDIYLQQLPPSTLDRLFAQPCACLAVFRLLPPLAQQYVLRLLFLAGDGNAEVEVEEDTLEAWHGTGRVGADKEASLQVLERLGVLSLPVESTTTSLARKSRRTLHARYQAGLQHALTAGRWTGASLGNVHEEEGSFGETLSVSLPDRQELDRIAKQRWESILHFLVGSSSSSNSGHDLSDNMEEPQRRREKRSQLSGTALRLLHDSGLMARINPEKGEDPVRRENLRITSKGFQFLLLDVHTQIWSLLLHYVDLADKVGMDTVRVLQLFFQLGMLQTGRAYVRQDWQNQVLRDLRDFGVVELGGGSSEQQPYFVPTCLAALLSTDTQPGKQEAGTIAGEAATGTAASSASIIVETNYRVYAYTDSPLPIAILGLFVHFKFRFRNLVVGILTRDSVRSALVNGITASQMIRYLSAHAHPSTKSSGGPSVPPTVVDQINLWEMENNRLQFTKGYLYKDFDGDEILFEAAVRYARDLGVLRWHTRGRATGSNSSKCYLMVDEEGHQAVRAFVKERIAEQKQQQQSGAS